MATESAKVIIDAEDKASKKVAVAAANVEKSIKGIKDVGGKAKASTEFIGTLATNLGGNEVGAYAGQLAQLTERISAFSEVSSAGAAGALAFKAGLVGVAAVLSFQVGTAIGDVIFQTQKWREELEKATAEAQRLNAVLLKSTSQRFSLELEEIDLIRDPEQQEQKLNELLQTVEQNITAKVQQINEKASAEEDWMTAWFGSPEDRAAITDTTELEQQLELLREQRDTLRESTSERRKELDSQREQNALQDKSDAYLETLRQELELLKASKEEVIEITAARNATAQDRGQAEALLRERDAILAKQQAEKEAEAERVANMRQMEADRKRLQAEQQRLSEKQASEAEALAKRMNADTSLTGTQGRLLTRGAGEDKQQKIVEHTKKTSERLQQVYEELQELNRNMPSSDSLKLEVVD